MATQEAVQDIPTEKIRRSPFHVRGVSWSASDLADNIEEQGLIQPILVRPVNGEYEVVAGLRRFTAAKELGWDSVPCRVLEMDDDEAMMAMLSENEFREDVDEEERAKLIARLLGRNDLLDDNSTTSLQKYSAGELAEKLGKQSEKAIRSMLEPLLRTEKTQELVNKGDLSEYEAQRIRQFTKQDEEAEEELAEAVASAEETVGGSRKEFQRELKRAKEKGEDPHQLAERIKRKERVRKRESESGAVAKPGEAEETPQTVTAEPEGQDRSQSESIEIPEQTSVTIEPGRDLIRGLQRASEERAAPMDEVIQIALEQWLDERGYL